MTNEIPNGRLDQPLTPADLERARRIRWQWVLAYNRARAAPRSLQTDMALAQCEKAIDAIDAILAAQPTIS